MTGSASELARRLGEDAEAVCREYLSSGHRSGNYWIVGDVRNTRGRSMHVRLNGNAKGPAGKWVDEQNGEHGDLLDVIRESCGLIEFRDVADEARRFLAIPRPQAQDPGAQRQPAAIRDSPEAARRLFGMSQPIAGTLAECYLAGRGIPLTARERALRFHPGCYYRDLVTGATQTLRRAQSTGASTSNSRYLKRWRVCRHAIWYCGPRYIDVYTSAAQERAMATTATRKETPVSMRFRDDDLTIIDRGAKLLGLSRTEFMRRAALHEAQAAILNETVIRVSPEAYDAFMQAISAPAAAPPPKAAERLRRSPPWDR